MNSKLSSAEDKASQHRNEVVELQKSVDTAELATAELKKEMRKLKKTTSNDLDQVRSLKQDLLLGKYDFFFLLITVHIWRYQRTLFLNTFLVS